MEKNTNIFNLKIAHILGVGFSIVFTLFIVICLLFVSEANAQSTGLSISPVKFEISVNPGETVSQLIKVSNTSNNPMQTRMVIQDFAPIGESGEVRVLPEGEENSTYSLAEWVTINPIEFIVDPGSVQTIEFKINVPVNAEPGGHYASVLASAGGGSSGATVAQKVGSLLLLHVAGDVVEELNVKSMHTYKKGSVETSERIKPVNFFEYGPISISTRFENTGTVHLKPLGFILVKNMYGQEVEKVSIPQQNVLPNSIRKIDVDFGEKWMFGKYTATMTAIYGSTNEPLSYSTTFWVFPWKVGGAVALGALLVLWFLFKARKRIRVAFRVLFRGH